MKKLLLALSALSFTLFSCSSINYVNKKIELLIFFQKMPLVGAYEECNKILTFYTADNRSNQIFQKAPLNQKVFIKALLLNKTSIKAMS